MTQNPPTECENLYLKPDEGDIKLENIRFKSVFLKTQDGVMDVKFKSADNIECFNSKGPNNKQKTLLGRFRQLPTEESGTIKLECSTSPKVVTTGTANANNTVRMTREYKGKFTVIGVGLSSKVIIKGLQNFKNLNSLRYTYLQENCEINITGFKGVNNLESLESLESFKGLVVEYEQNGRKIKVNDLKGLGLRCECKHPDTEKKEKIQYIIEGRIGDENEQGIIEVVSFNKTATLEFFTNNPVV